jgi:hypothetical protein
VVKGKAVPDYNLCDVIVYRQALTIVRNDGIVMNNHSGFGHYIEIVPAVINTTEVFGEKSVNTDDMPPSATSSPSSPPSPSPPNPKVIILQQHLENGLCLIQR